jgi:ribosomal protein L37AE/L43A
MEVEVCDVCGSTNIKEIKCKVICQNCGTILKSCADLHAVTLLFGETRHGS